VAPRFLVEWGVKRAELDSMSLMEIMDVLEYAREAATDGR
jgi:hypothetical protein